MRDAQEQLDDLEKVVTKGLENIRKGKLIKYTHPIVLEGQEGIIIRDLLELIAAGDKDVDKMSKGGAINYDKSPVYCSLEFSLSEGD